MSEQATYKPGTYWKTQCAGKARVLNTMKNGNVVIECRDAVIVLTPDGQDSGGHYGLVSEWREPARVLVTLYRNSASGKVRPFFEHTPCLDWDAIGTVWAVEGQFAEGGES